MNSEEVLLTPREVAALIQVSERKVYELVRKGELPAKRYGGQWRFSRAAVLAAGDPKEQA